jgi:ribosomal protein S18 acetylase RimI-like enzyme
VTEIALRPETPGDEEFLRVVYAWTRAGELERTPWTDEQKAAFVAMQFEAQRSYYREVYPDAAYDVVVVDGQDAGRLYVARLPGEIRVVDISLLPEFRGRGVGGSLLGDVQAEAASSGRKVVIHVEQQNPAKALYLRLGFEPVEDLGVYLRMEWTAAAS